MIKTTERPLDRFDDFCQRTSLHGYVYLRRNNPMPVWDRILWVSIIVVNLVVSGFLLSDVWKEWVSDPFVIVYDSNIKTIWEIPFPSVTVCGFNSVKRSVVDLGQVNETDGKLLFFSSMVCPNNAFFEKMNLTVNETEIDSFYSFLDQATPSCQQMMKRCFWQNREFDCCQHFHPVITDSGLCYTFNTLPLNIIFTKEVDRDFVMNSSRTADTRYWAPGSGYPPGRGVSGLRTKFYPYWANSVGYEKGLSVELAHIIDEAQPECSGGNSGFKAMINSAEDAPISSEAAVKIALDRDAVLQISPLTISTASDLSYTPATLRGCFFQGEQLLRHFQYYSQEHCILECFAENFESYCGCVPFYIPRNSTTRVCQKFSDFICIRKVQSDMVVKNIDDNSALQDDLPIPHCGCYPACNQITYDFYLSNGVHLYKAPSLPWQRNISERTGFAKLTIFYTQRHFFGIHREAQGHLLDVLGTCGGLLGLLMGFSCIALVDVFYHSVFRPMGCAGQLPKNTPPSSSFKRPTPHPFFIN